MRVSISKNIVKFIGFLAVSYIVFVVILKYLLR